MTATGTVDVAGVYAYVEETTNDVKLSFVGTYVEETTNDIKTEFVGLYVEEDWEAYPPIVSMNVINEIVMGSLIVR
jgi:hypothetical protein